MTKIKAKPISSTFWILRKDNKKIGQLTKSVNGYDVSINGNKTTVKHKSDLGMIEFIEIVPIQRLTKFELYNFPTDSYVYNGVWNLQYKLPLYTKEENSKSWYAAGWYKMNVKNNEYVIFCPKLITLQRNDYNGPFKEKPKILFEKFFE